MKVKLTNLDGATQGGLVWGDGTRHAAKNQNGKMKLCSDTVIHFYDDEYLAVVMNLAHGDFNPCIARRFEPEGKVISDGTKSGCRAGTTYEVIQLPEISLEAKIRFGILCALQVCAEPKFVTWATNWLNGLDRTNKSTAAAYAADAAAADADETKQKINFVSLIHESIEAENKIEKG